MHPTVTGCKHHKLMNFLFIVKLEINREHCRVQLRGTQCQQRAKSHALRARTEVNVEGEEEEKSLPPKRPRVTPTSVRSGAAAPRSALPQDGAQPLTRHRAGAAAPTPL